VVIVAVVVVVVVVAAAAVDQGTDMSDMSTDIEKEQIYNPTTECLIATTCIVYYYVCRIIRGYVPVSKQMTW